MSKNIKTAYLRGFVIFLFFLITACVISAMRQHLGYLIMFTGIGIIAGVTEFLIAANPARIQIVRRLSLFGLGALLLFLALKIGINFQFPQIIFDLYAGIVTGALMQFIAARVLLPFLFGSSFCSRACWDGAVFELAELSGISWKKSPKVATKRKESCTSCHSPKNNDIHSRGRGWMAWSYLIGVVTLTCSIGFFWYPESGTEMIRWIFLGHNLFIITVGITLSFVLERRAYCRHLCPFLTISGLFARFSLFKVTPVKSEACTKCRKCTKECPMGIDVMQYVVENKRIKDPNCIMCEECITACPVECIAIAVKN